MIADHHRQADVLIIGGGLCGLNLARLLQERNKSCLILEGRDRPGGRILSRPYQSAISDSLYDLGPAWFWPQNRRMQVLIETLGLNHTVFEQYGSGAQLFEDGTGRIQQTMAGMSMTGSYRLDGGMQSLTEGIAALLEPQTILLGCPVKQIELFNGRMNVLTEYHGEEAVFYGQQVVLALPPRVAVNTIIFQPGFDDKRLIYLKQIQTWMAAQGKVIVQYAEPFWRSNGQSGDAFSLIGPIRELHDASSRDGSNAALFGFLDQSFLSPATDIEFTKVETVNQLVGLFGDQARLPIDVTVQRWTDSSLTCTAEDLSEAPLHSYHSMKPLVEPEWESRLIWSGSEAADARQQINGYLEGALAASEQSNSTLLKTLQGV